MALLRVWSDAATSHRSSQEIVNSARYTCVEVPGTVRGRRSTQRHHERHTHPSQRSPARRRGTVWSRRGLAGVDGTSRGVDPQRAAPTRACWATFRHPGARGLPRDTERPNAGRRRRGDSSVSAARDCSGHGRVVRPGLDRSLRRPHRRRSTVARHGVRSSPRAVADRALAHPRGAADRCGGVATRRSHRQRGHRIAVDRRTRSDRRLPPGIPRGRRFRRSERSAHPAAQRLRPFIAAPTRATPRRGAPRRRGCGQRRRVHRSTASRRRRQSTADRGGLVVAAGARARHRPGHHGHECRGPPRRHSERPPARSGPPP